MAREIIIMTPEQVQLKFELAGIGSRFMAMIVDTLIQSAAIFVLAILFIATGATLVDNAVQSLSYVWFAVACVLVLFFVLGGYFLYFEAVKNGQTPGKKYARIRVVRDTGHPIDFRSALLRNLMRIVDVLPSAYGVGMVSVFFSHEYRRLGDYVGGTLVVKVGREADVLQTRSAHPDYSAQASSDTSGPTQAFPVNDALPPEAMPFISSIEKDEYRAIRHFLDRRAALEYEVIANLSTRLAAPVAGKLRIEMSSIPDPVAFLEAVSNEWERRVIH